MAFQSVRDKELPLALLTAIGFAGMAALVFNGRIESFDRAVIGFWQRLENPTLTRIMLFFTRIGSGLPVACIALASALFLFIVLKHRRELLLLGFSLGGSALLNVALKEAIHRERPTLHRLIEATGFAFPSGHSMGAFTLYGTLTFLLWRHIPRREGRALLIAAGGFLILAIGSSRIYLGVHYPSDVLAGYLASGSWLAVAVFVFRKTAGRIRFRG